MKTFNQETKTKWINVMQEHQDADRLIQGSWFEDGKGCFFGCAMQTSNNPLSKAIDVMHLPEWLIYLAEKIFEGLPKEEALTFPVQLLESIPVDTDIESIRHELAIKRLTNLISDSHDEEVNNAIKLVIEYHKTPSEQLRSVAWSVAESAWSVAESAARSVVESARSAAWSVAESALSVAESAESAARSAAESAARSAAESAARSVAESAARSVVESARSAAWSVAESAWSVAESAAWKNEQLWLIELLNTH